MKKIFILALLFGFLNVNSSYCAIVGKINHDDINYKNKIIDKKTKRPLDKAKITVPEMNYTTYSDENGLFKLNVDLSKQTVLFIEKEGYKVFSLTVDNNVIKNPLRLGIEESSPFDLQISKDIIHLGDNLFSSNSANSNEFRTNANGHFLSQTFKAPSIGSKEVVVIKIGTIIGLDTKKAKTLGQNRIAQVYSSPTEVFVNGKKIANIELNGDNIEIPIPKNILKSENELVIKTGKNLFQHEYVDYDDIELANLRIETRKKDFYASFK